jgi:tellurite resistance protein
VATLAWFDLHGGQIDTVTRMLGGFGLLMILAQVRLLPAYLKLPFMPSTWSFAFSWSAVAAAGIQWLQAAQAPGYQAEQYVVIAASSALVVAIAIRTAMAAYRRQLMPAQLTGLGPVCGAADKPD